MILLAASTAIMEEFFHHHRNSALTQAQVQAISVSPPLKFFKYFIASILVMLIGLYVANANLILLFTKFFEATYLQKS